MHNCVLRDSAVNLLGPDEGFGLSPVTAKERAARRWKVEVWRGMSIGPSEPQLCRWKALPADGDRYGEGGHGCDEEDGYGKGVNKTMRAPVALRAIPPGGRAANDERNTPSGLPGGWVSRLRCEGNAPAHRGPTEARPSIDTTIRTLIKAASCPEAIKRPGWTRVQIRLTSDRQPGRSSAIVLDGRDRADEKEGLGASSRRSAVDLFPSHCLSLIADCFPVALRLPPPKTGIHKLASAPHLLAY
ncbi:hypothetical protein BDK51DRAFT_44902 [Blyttiomyces helicus]|uniref:Uncharacterized protein n=1 Tax=Blyttiomyces helicus TaxID=388810 RepID=A0A4P9WMV2_9FUNG|nr:hypothetical protein BDK51DRAFT_44902 [Blyttiomyces helicus]|eukprot:RKO93363.1 hypothetical protein BDK51DRAFT_44902 [Blyttiomyces helicus]